MALARQVSLDRYLLSKRVSVLSPEEKQLLIQWYIATRGKRAYAIDRRRSGRVALTVAQWARKPNRYDIPGVDAPESTRIPSAKTLSEYQLLQLKKLPHEVSGRARPRSVEEAREEKRYIKKLADRLWISIPEKARGKWRYIQVYNLAKMVYRYAKETGADPEVIIDKLSDADWEQGYGYVKGVMHELIGGRVARSGKSQAHGAGDA